MQGLLESIIKASRKRKIIAFKCQKCSKKTRSNELIPTEKKATERSYVKFLGILMVKKPTDKKYKVFDCDSRNFVVRLRYTYAVLLRKILVGLGMLYVS